MKIKNHTIVRSIRFCVLVGLWSLMFCGSSSAQPSNDYSTVKISPPPSGGMYVGQYEFSNGDDTRSFESSIGRHAAMWGPYWVVEMDEEGNPEFNVELAEKAWNEGYVVVVWAYEASPGLEDNPPDFTIDRLLKGEYDESLRRLAAQFRAFGKPMFFNTAREPNGVLSNTYGGFGPDGSKDTAWATATNRGLAEFNPSQLPNAELYKGLGDPEVCDGLERMAAAQRYYYDFFVRREGLQFLTFDTMGWGAFPLILGPGEPAAEADLLTRCNDFMAMYPGDEYVDWISFGWYLTGESIPIDQHLEYMDSMLNMLDKVTPDKPVFFIELGFPDGKKRDSLVAARRVELGIELMLSHPQVGGFTMWTKAHTGFPYDNLMRRSSSQGKALRRIISNNPSSFHSCVYFSDGRKIPTCPE